VLVKAQTFHLIPKETKRRLIFPMKSITLYLLVMLTILLTGCADHEKKMTFWIGGAPQEVDYWEALVNEFERTSGIAVDLIRQPSSTDQRKQGLVISLEAEQPDPDVFLMDIVWLQQFFQSGWLQPLDPFWRTDGFLIAPFFKDVVDTVDRLAGHYYALPVFLDIGVLYYRKDLLKKYGYSGPPRTWSDLLQQALEIQAGERSHNPGFNGFLWQGAQYEGLVCTFLEFSASNGGGIMQDGHVRLNRGANAVALEFMQNLIRQYGISPLNTYTDMREEEVRRAFQRGDALFERNWLYAWSLHQKDGSAVKGKIGMTALPQFEEGQSVAALGGWHIGISRHSDMPAKAWELVRFILSPASQKKLVLNLGWYPGRSDIYTDPEVLKKMPYAGLLQEIFSRVVTRPNLPYYDQVSDVIQRTVNGCLAGKQPPDAALLRMQSEIDHIEDIYANKK
jgi:multiple sugar transport system substrate-binding protein